jgi:hypothetical protein
MPRRRKPQDDPRWLLLALLLLLLVGGGVAVLIGTSGGGNAGVIAHQPEPEPQPQPRPARQPIPDLPGPQPLPEPTRPAEPEPEPEPKADPDPPHVDVPDLSPFGRMLVINDTILALRDPPRAGSPDAWAAYSVLYQLDSNHRYHALALYRGKATGAEHSAFRETVERLCFRPDFFTDAFRNRTGGAVTLRFYGDARLPPANSGRAVTLEEIARFRPSEDVTPALASAWLQAMEREFGRTGYGSEVPPLDFLLFQDEYDYLRFCPIRLGVDVPAWSSGFFSPRWQLAGGITDTVHNVAETVRHELFHALQSRVAPDSLNSPWFTEGTASWLSKAPPGERGLRTNSRFREVAWGYLRTELVAGLAFDLHSFLRMEPDEFYGDPRLHYMLAYCWVDFVRGEPALMSLYREYWRLMREGVGYVEALLRTFLKLDLQYWQERFIQHAYTFAPVSFRPRFISDASPRAGTRETGAPLEPLGQWEGALERLWYAGFDTRPGPLTQSRDLQTLIVLLDDTVSMDDKLKNPNFDYEAFSRRQFALRLVHGIRIGNDDEVPMTVRLPLIEAVLANRVAEYKEATGIEVSDQLARSIRTLYEESFAFTAEALAEMTRHQLAVIAAESVAAFTLSPQERSRVIVVHFNVTTKDQAIQPPTRRRLDYMSGNPLLGEALAAGLDNKRVLADGSDCDWWEAMQTVTRQLRRQRGGGAGLLILTDSLNTSGDYGRSFRQPDDPDYRQDQERLLEALARHGPFPEVGGRLRESLGPMHVEALPGADLALMRGMAALHGEGTVSDWAGRYVRR